MQLQVANTKLQAQIDSLTNKNADLEEKCAKMRVDLRDAQSRGGGGDPEAMIKLAEQVEQILAEKQRLQERFDEVNEKNKALRHKAG